MKNPCANVTAIKPVSHLDAMDVISEKQQQLSALLHTIGGDGFGRFQEMSAGIQTNLLWLASSLADDIGTACQHLRTRPD